METTTTSVDVAKGVESAKIHAEIDALIAMNIESRKQIKVNKARIVELKKLAGRKKMSPEQKEVAKKARQIAKLQAKLAELNGSKPSETVVAKPETDKAVAQSVAPVDKLADIAKTIQ